MGNYFKHYFADAYENYKEYVKQYRIIGARDNDLSLFDPISFWFQPIGQGGCPEYVTEILVKKYNKDYKQSSFIIFLLRWSN